MSIETLPLLVDPNGRPLVLKEEERDRAQRLNAFGGPYVLGSSDLKGAVPNPRRADWKDYWDMYERHPIVFSAINKKVKVCTNTGFDFVPRDNRSDTNDDEVKRAREFFQKQINFISELRRVYRDLEIFGDAYLYVVPDRRRRPVRLKRIAPWTMNIKAGPNGKIQSYVQKDPMDPKAEPIIFRPHEILHFKYDNPVDDLYGMSPLESLKADIAADLYAASYNMNFFKNGAATGVILIVNDATDAQMDRNKQWLREEYVGHNNAHKPIILAGDVKLEKAVQTHIEMGFLEGREAIKAHILAVLDVAPAKIGDMGDANRSNSKEQDKTFRTESIMPTQYIIEEVINDQFMQPILGIMDTIFVHAEADVRDQQEQMDLFAKGIEKGIYNINEVRGKLGMKPTPGGDINVFNTATGAVPVVDFELYFRLAAMNTTGKNAIPEEMHEGHNHPKGENGQSGPDPKSTNNVETGEAHRSLEIELIDLVKAFTRNPNHAPLQRALYAQTAESDDPLLSSAATSLRKALSTDDEILRLAHLEKAHAALLLGVSGAADEHQ